MDDEGSPTNDGTTTDAASPTDERSIGDWSRVDDAADPDAYRSYLDAVTGVDAIEAVKRRSYDLLDLDTGARVLDVGCGTGEDVVAVADRVGESGAVVGVDASEEMVAAARERHAGETRVSFRVADAEALPFDDGAFDAARADRVLQHLERPEHALSELRRVTRPGGRVAVVDSDWGTLTVDAAAEVADLSDRLSAPTWGCARNGRIGRRLRRLAVAAGLSDVDVEAGTLVLTHFDAADEVLGLRGRVDRMTAAGELSTAERDRWLDALRRADDAGTFTASLCLFTVTGRVPVTDSEPDGGSEPKIDSQPRSDSRSNE